MKKSKFEYSRMEYVMIIVAVITMPAIAVTLIEFESDEFIKYIGLWITIAIGFAVVHLKLRNYYELIFGKEEKENV